MKQWIGENGREFYSFIEAAYALKPSDSIDHKRLKGLLPYPWDWETKQWIFQ